MKAVRVSKFGGANVMKIKGISYRRYKGDVSTLECEPWLWVWSH